MIVGEAQLVSGIVIAIRKIDQLDGLDTQSFVAMRNAGRYQDFPRLKSSDEHCVDGTESRRVAAQIVEEDLKHARNRSPKIGLFGVIMDCFYGARIREGERYLNFATVVGDHFRGRSEDLKHARNRSPKIGLFGVIMDCFYGARIREGERYLNFATVVGDHFRG